MPSSYPVGDLVQLTSTFTTVATGALVNPTTVTFTIQKPDRTISTPTPSNPSTGVFSVQVLVDQAGEWLWRVTGTGAAAAASVPGQGVFEVAKNYF